ncbi:sulfotransferase [uncultured Eudoraea sp.]|uniref:sulfotransferase family protein n=1 Tax=uncultured Eudoraea sp. TaxID=1035614 RepID=UPI002629E305|nr:sulfotransferase [uncultured Eudoraea sp.]
MSKLTKKIRRRIYRELKHLNQDLLTPNHKEKKIVFIMGAQRSGTTMLTNLFERDKTIRVYQEFSRLTPNLRLIPYPKVQEQINRNHAGVIVLKPLVESQNIDQLFSFFPESKSIWAFRHFRDVGSSNLKKFGLRNGIDDLRPIYHEDNENWRVEGISNETKAIIKDYFSEDMSPRDAAALFWYTRNILFFERDLTLNDRVYLLKYRDLVSEPSKKIKEVYDFVGIEHPKYSLVSDVNASSIGKGKQFELSPEIETLCEELWNRLNTALKIQNKKESR